MTDKQKERINIIKTSSETLLSLISDLLDAQKLELRQLKMRKEYVNIGDTIADAIKGFVPQAHKSKIEIISNIQNVSIEHDPERIKQVISNLVKNSLNAVEPEKGRIEILMENLPQVIQISVKDNGIGIPTDKQVNLFKKFYQVDATLTREKGGSGLGLAICKGIMENHGGKISVRSIPKAPKSQWVTVKALWYGPSDWLEGLRRIWGSFEGKGAIGGKGSFPVASLAETTPPGPGSTVLGSSGGLS